MGITPELKLDLRHLAFERFLYDFVLDDNPDRQPHEPSDALWTFIPELYHSVPEDSCLAKVIDAVAYVNFASRCNAPQAEALGEDCMGKGIALLSKMIADKKLAASNEALCAVYMMGAYEVCMSKLCTHAGLIPRPRILQHYNERALSSHISMVRTHCFSCAPWKNTIAIRCLQSFMRWHMRKWYLHPP